MYFPMRAVAVAIIGIFFCDKKFFCGNVCLSHVGNLSVASPEALIQRCSLMKYGVSIGRYSFKTAVLKISSEKYQR